MPLHHSSGWNYLDQAEWEELCRHCLHSLDVSSIQNVFDAGCGVGALLQYIQTTNKAIQLYGCDICEDSVHRCKQLFPQAHITTDSICDISGIPSNTFDFVCSISTISYLDSLSMAKTAVVELLRIAKPGALLSFCVLTDDIHTMKSFTLLLPKQWWTEQSFDVSSIVIEDISMRAFHGRYSVFMIKNKK